MMNEFLLLGQEDDVGAGQATERRPGPSIISCMCLHMRWPFKSKSLTWRGQRGADQLAGKKLRMTAHSALPTGFREVEVLAVGTVLLLEGETGRTRARRVIQWVPSTQIATGELARSCP